MYIMPAIFFCEYFMITEDVALNKPNTVKQTRKLSSIVLVISIFAQFISRKLIGHGVLF